MFGSEVLDIAIGLVLVFLLVSLILTAAQEALEALLKSRGKTLQRALHEIFQHDPALLQRFYEHPLVFSLYRQSYDGLPASGASGRNLPSYIPRETFSAVMTHLRSTRELASNARVAEAVAACESLCDGSTRRMRQELEGWYDSAMDRASGHYKRRTQGILFGMGVVTAVVLNINAVVVGQYLAVSTTARDQIVRLAGATATEPTPSASPSPTLTSTLTAAPVAEPTPQATATGNNAESTQETGATVSAGPVPSASPSAAAQADTQNAGGSVSSGPIDANKLYADLTGLQLPIGWGLEARRHIDHMVGTGSGLASASPLVVTGAWLTFLAGYLITALAAMLGAPFWFDVLNRLMVIRATVKPKEKSPDEPSQDGGAKKRGTDAEEDAAADPPNERDHDRSAETDGPTPATGTSPPIYG